MLDIPCCITKYAPEQTFSFQVGTNLKRIMHIKCDACVCVYVCVYVVYYKVSGEAKLYLSSINNIV